MKRRKCQEFNKHRRSPKWKEMENKYRCELEKAKQGYYREKIRNLRKQNPRNWHREIKKLKSLDQHTEELSVKAIKDLPVSEQAELIADKFASVSHEFEKLKTDDIEIPPFNEKDIPQFEEQAYIL